MTHTMRGIVTIVQESRFQILGDDGVYHLFLLGRNAAAETIQLTALQHRQARVRVRYRPAANLIGNTATAITLEDA
jgi:hypothetical protein